MLCCAYHTPTRCTFRTVTQLHVSLQTDSDMIFAEAYRAGSPLLQHYQSWMPVDDSSPAPFMLLKSLLRQGKQEAQLRSVMFPLFVNTT